MPGVDQSTVIKIMKGESVTYGEDYGVPFDDEPDVNRDAYKQRVPKPPEATANPEQCVEFELVMAWHRHR